MDAKPSGRRYTRLTSVKVSPVRDQLAQAVAWDALLVIPMALRR